MKNIYMYLAVVLSLLIGQNYLLAQVPTLGTTENFALFTAVGAFSNTGATTITGDVGTHVGAFSGFPPGVVIGNIHVANGISAQAAADAEVAYLSMNPITCGIVLTPTLGNGQILTPDVYCIGMAATLNGELILDGGGDPNAIFIFKIDGAFATTTLSSITLINSASICNVYWQINGEFTIGESSSFVGTVLVNGAINLLEGASLEGRAISRSGAISTNNNVVNISEGAAPSMIIANGPTSFCLGGSVILSGNIDGIWNTGETTNSIEVNESGDYFVTNSTNCGDTISNIISINVFPLPVCNIAGPLSICPGQSSTLCATSGMSAYLWSTNETTECIIANSAGFYSVTITDINGCTSSCQVEVIIDLQAECIISGSPTFCEGGSTELCVPSGATSYLWSTGATTSCITVDIAGIYSVTITEIGGCISICELAVSSTPIPSCTISGELSICQGQSTELCASPGNTSYLWNTGETTSCINVTLTGTYSVTITDVSGCTSTCEVEVIAENPLPEIQCPADITIQCDESPLPPFTGEATSPDVCGTSPVISYTDSISQGMCAYEYTIWREWIATDLSSGNSSNCIQIITILDNQAPIITCPSNMTINCNESNLPANTGFATATDNCDPNPTLTYNDVLTGGNCPQQYIITRTWTASDECGNIITCSHTIQSIDNTAPVITCPPNIIIQCNVSNLPTNTGFATATDNCDPSPALTYSDVLISGNCPQQYTITRTWTATDDCGNTSTCIQTINSIDNTAPIIVCPASITVECDESTLPANTGFATATDNCDLTPTILYADAIINGSCLQEYTISRTWNATDDCGNTSVCTQVISVIDTISPEIIIDHPFYGLYQNGDIIWIQCESNTPGWDIPGINVEDDIILSDNCSEDISIEFSEINSVGDCIIDGFLLQRSWYWVATDECGNTGTFHLTINIVDTIAPVLLGVPDDITVNCDSIPICKDTLSCGSNHPNWVEYVTAQDECECVSIEFEEQIFEGNCSGQFYMLWIWTASDNCGNFTRDTQRVTFLNELGPIFEAVNPDLSLLKNGDILEVECLDSGLPQWVYGLNESDYEAYDRCSGNPLTTWFTNQFLGHSNCVESGYLQEFQLTWYAADDCGLTSSFSIFIRLVDTQAPVIENWDNNDIVCIGDFDINSISVYEGCSGFIHEIVEVPIPSYCIEGADDILRQIILIDGCNNRSTYEQVVLASYPGPSFQWNLPEMSHLQNGDTIQINCNIQNSLSLSGLRKRDIQILANCSDLVSTDFYEEFVELGDCIEDDFLKLIRVIWTGIDVCGIQNSFVLYAKVIDTIPPAINADAFVTLGCGDPLPVPIITDDCSDVIITITELERTLVPCPDYLVIIREIVAEDECGNISRLTQEIRISSDNEQMMDDMDLVVCTNDNSLPTLPDFTDNCTGVQLIPQVIVIPFTDECGANRGVKRTIILTNSCGIRQEMIQTIIFQDTITPEIAVFVPGLGYLKDGAVFELECGDDEVFFTLENASIVNACIGDEIELEITERVAEDCLVDGYLKRIRYMWVAKDACGLTSTFGISVIYRDTRKPEFTFVPDDQLVICDTIPPLTHAIAFDDCSDVNLVFTEQQTQLNNNIFIIRNWVATDDCGNSASASQSIEVRPTINFNCDISLIDSLICNSDSIRVRAITFGGRGPYTYEWRAEGGSCSIESGQGTPNITIRIGYSKVTIYLKITDSNDCVSECIFEQECTPFSTRELGANVFDQVEVFPNPAYDVIYFTGKSLFDGNIIVQIHDGFGVQHQQENVYLKKGENYTLTTDISRFVSGVFYIQVIHENGQVEIHRVLKF